MRLYPTKRVFTSLDYLRAMRIKRHETYWSRSIISERWELKTSSAAILPYIEKSRDFLRAMRFEILLKAARTIGVDGWSLNFLRAMRIKNFKKAARWNRDHVKRSWCRSIISERWELKLVLLVLSKLAWSKSLDFLRAMRIIIGYLLHRDRQLRIVARLSPNDENVRHWHVHVARFSPSDEN